MEDNKKLLNVQAILRDVLENPNLEIAANTKLGDIPNLESVSYMTAIALIESEYGMQFDFDDISNFKTIGELLEKIK